MRPLQTLQRQIFRLAVLGALASTLACQSSGESQLSPEQGQPEQGQYVAGQTVEPIRGMVGVGTWATQAEFKDIKVTKGNQTLYASDFSQGLQGWKTMRGKWEVVNGALRQTSNEEDVRAVFGDPSWSDYTLSLKARKLGGNEGFLILFGLPDENEKSWWNVGGWGNTRHGLEASGVGGEQVTGRLETGRWYDIRIELKGNTIRAFLDNQLIHSATQASSTHTVVFSTETPGKKMPLTQWGLDTAWAEPNNVRRGLLYMGKDQVDIVRVSFPINTPLVNGDLPASKDAHFTTRIELANHGPCCRTPKLAFIPGLRTGTMSFPNAGCN
jgi:hypothetical protein